PGNPPGAKQTVCSLRPLTGRQLIRMRFLLLFQVLAGALWCQAPDVAGSSDPFLFKRVSGFQIAGFKEEPRGSMSFKTGGPSDLMIEGRKTVITYRNTGPAISAPSILQHYQRAVLALGGKVLNQTPQSITLLARGKSSEIWLT